MTHMDQALRCPACRYLLNGLPDGHCPECGESFTNRELVTRERTRAECERCFQRSMLLLLLTVAAIIVGGSTVDLLAMLAFIAAVGGIAAGFTSLWFAFRASKSPARPVMALAWAPAILALVGIIVHTGLGWSALGAYLF